MEFLETFIRKESLIMIPVLYLIGLFLRQTPKFPMWLSPWIKMVIGIIFCVLYYGLDITAVVQGILVSGAAVLMRDLIHPLEDSKDKPSK